jgi:membrane protein implicated in regulation of membrane protease activity
VEISEYPRVWEVLIMGIEICTRRATTGAHSGNNDNVLLANQSEHSHPAGGREELIMETMFWIWMAAALLFLIVEIGLPGLVFACFATGAVGAAFYAQAAPDSYLMQTAIFAVISIVLVPLTRKFAKKISSDSAQKSNVDALINKPAIVIKAIDPLEGAGQVRIQGEIWSAQSDSSISDGSKVTVISVDGNSLKVRPGLPERESAE